MFASAVLPGALSRRLRQKRHLPSEPAHAARQECLTNLVYKKLSELVVSGIEINVTALLGIYGDKSVGAVRNNGLLPAVGLTIDPVLGKTRIRIVLTRLPLSKGQPEGRDYRQLS
jgi:hypothetical protein